ncbi:MAG: NAD-dependent epimerase/dehydratase family protein [Bacteroidales bacterium]|nr:NAD-dependent epimerase/dehydratase family protein [Bacteroidales bacterium]
MPKVLITGTAGFIGFHLSNSLIARGYDVVGLDIINDYYDVNLKYGRLKEAGIERESIEYNKLLKSSKYDNYKFIKLKLEDQDNINDLFKKEKFDFVVNLAAQAGVRYSLENPHAYINSNIIGYTNILEACRHNSIKHLVYASSSSVYGLNTKMPFSTSDNVDHPISLYAASKKSNELMAHTYSYLFDLPTTGLRFFTVYGPWGRPDMALFLFTKAIMEGNKIDVYNYGNMQRDFTYVDDIVKGIVKVLENKPKKREVIDNPSVSKAPYKIYNIGNSSPVKLNDFIEAIEKALDKKADRNLMPIQPGDVEATWADVTDLTDDLEYKPETDIKYGVNEFIKWYKSFYKAD